MIALAFGKLPSKSFFFARCAAVGHTEPAELWRLAQESLRVNGPNPVLEQTLNTLGFQWSAAPSIEEDIVAVSDALGGDQ